MKAEKDNTSYFSGICIERCKGMCCDPWWGIISYTVVKEGGLSRLGGFRDDLINGIKARRERIMEAYVTNEASARPLFGSPERYNVIVREIKANGGTLALNLLAMFAFRCKFLSEEKACTIHPALLNGREIRPPHCGYMGSLNVSPGEKGYCRIIHAAEPPSADASSIERAIEIEKGASDRHFGEGFPTVEEAADAVIAQLRDYCATNLTYLLPQQRLSAPGRNEPCHCGSGIKFKRCHGR